MMFRELILIVGYFVFGAPASGQASTFEPVTVYETAPAPTCGGALTQGGIVVCSAAPVTKITVGGQTRIADENGTAQFGLSRAAPATLGWSTDDGTFGDLIIAERNDDFRTIKGMDCDKVDARTAEQKAHAARSWTTKADAFATFHDGRGAMDGFILPAEGPPTSPFGPTRKYIGVSKATGESCTKTSVHRGYDMATPVGTPVIAPAAGTIILSDPDLYYEGGAVFLDHGQGVTSVFMHLSEVLLEPGDKVERGDLIAKTGNTGRTTGPHLHWAVKARNPGSDKRGDDFYIDPALLLGLPLVDLPTEDAPILAPTDQ